MIVNIEFFDKEIIENIITALNYKVDKIIFFGHSDVMTEEARNNTKKALNRICGVFDISFVELSKKSFDRIIGVMEENISREINQGNKCFFDLTGGDDLVLVAMGILSARYENPVPLHRFDVEKNEINMLNRNSVKGIDELAEKRTIELDLDDIISFSGGIIKESEHKQYKRHLDNPQYKTDLYKLWDVIKENYKKWNIISGIVKTVTLDLGSRTGGLIPKEKINKAISNIPDMDYKAVESYLTKIKNRTGLLTYLESVSEGIRITFKNEQVKGWITEAGCPLELRTYYDCVEKGIYQDVRVGVHIDWDGVIQGPEEDVKNELDVVCLSGNVPSFISCKNGNVSPMSLYEVMILKERFGGKHSKAVLVTSLDPGEVTLNRADEMGIEVIQSGECF